MKKMLLPLFLGTLLISATASAQTGYKGHHQDGHTAYNPQAGYTGPSATMTVKAALSLADDTPVTLRGKITQSLGGEKYLFTDETGSIQIEIDNKVFARSGAQVSATDTVEISGKVDKEWNKKTEVEVKMIKKL